MLRLAGLIAFVILAVVLLVVLARGCSSSSKHAKYENYITDVRGIASRSAEIGKQLNATLAATGIKESQLEAKTKGTQPRSSRRSRRRVTSILLGLCASSTTT